MLFMLTPVDVVARATSFLSRGRSRGRGRAAPAVLPAARRIGGGNRACPEKRDMKSPEAILAILMSLIWNFAKYFFIRIHCQAFTCN
ncbi:hypothetical protein [Burkholderia pseudomallei]|uniref:hypothetical protein n=1 Tax=Burkholderia pseudomallei TaxID=28450 RepID=UPI001035E8CC|nr:hypothetical protein [Burkholderia pseudomallei]QBI39599.1 hypothetical protein EXY28_06780 [Burkholderia pseudomallei]QBI46286.1 hypothetical protein EXY72_06820 [Burkholderia pseudomallei]QBP48070.1 hypothetical protein E2R28_06845 [Burkholderia pseudomallei]QBP54695.1 hypothetical protein E2R23_06815 [Burkholderia pseudomallei]QBP67979.1 hypothetical protein E2R25_06870 [Burkholderia pseudomallei]